MKQPIFPMLMILIQKTKIDTDTKISNLGIFMKHLQSNMNFYFPHGGGPYTCLLQQIGFEADEVIFQV